MLTAVLDGPASDSSATVRRVLRFAGVLMGTSTVGVAVTASGFSAAASAAAARSSARRRISLALIPRDWIVGEIEVSNFWGVSVSSAGNRRN